VAVAGPLDEDLVEDRQIGTLVPLLEPGKFPVRVRGGLAGHGEGGADVPRAGHVDERLEQAASDDQELAKEGLLDLMNRLLPVGGESDAFDEVPEGLEPLVDLHRAGLLLGGRGEIELDGGQGGRKHERGSSLLWCVPGHQTSGNLPQEEGRFEARSTDVETLKP
jgi:hypothetical protein